MLHSKLLVMQKLLNTNAHLAQRAPYSDRFVPYLYGLRNDMAVIDLENTLISLRRACHIIDLVIRAKGHLLFVNTNFEYNGIIQSTASLAEQSYINHKWMGGLLTNWPHMQNVQHHFHMFSANSLQSEVGSASHSSPLQGSKERKEADFKPTLPLLPETQSNAALPSLFGLLRASRPQRGPSGPSFRKSLKKTPQPSYPRLLAGNELHKVKIPASTGVSVSSIEGVRASSLFRSFPRFKKMQKCFEGLVAKQLPDCVIVLNATQNSIAIHEAKQLRIPIISLVDSNTPHKLHQMITYPIPANDDSLQFVYLFCNCILKTILLSKNILQYEK